MVLQGDEFRAADALAAALRALPPVVDDDYPAQRHAYEGALRAFLRACAANGRTSPVPGEQLGADAISAGEYQAFVRENWAHRRNPANEGDTRDLRHLFIAATGLAGEAGEVVELLKKHVRDGEPIDRMDLELELGDVVYYVCALADRFNLNLPMILAANRTKLLQRRAWGGKNPPPPGPNSPPRPPPFEAG